MEPFFCKIFKKYSIIYVPSWTCEFTFHSALSNAESPACLKLHSSSLCVNWSPHTDLYARVVVLWTFDRHCQWKRLVCKAQTTSTTLLDKKALVKAFGSDAILMGVTCKYATAVAWRPRLFCFMHTCQAEVCTCQSSSPTPWRAEV